MFVPSIDVPSVPTSKTYLPVLLPPYESVVLVGIPLISEPLGNIITNAFVPLLEILPLLPKPLNTLCKLEPLPESSKVAVLVEPYE